MYRQKRKERLKIFLYTSKEKELLGKKHIGENGLGILEFM